MKQLDKAFNITPEVVPEEPKPVVREKPDLLFYRTSELSTVLLFLLLNVLKICSSDPETCKLQ